MASARGLWEGAHVSVLLGACFSRICWSAVTGVLEDANRVVVRPLNSRNPVDRTVVDNCLSIIFNDLLHNKVNQSQSLMVVKVLSYDWWESLATRAHGAQNSECIA
jgi:hypothetical protein